MKKLLIILTSFFCLTLYSQEQKEHEKKSYVNPKGEYHVQVELPIYLFVSTKPEPTGAHKLTSKKTPEYANPMYLDGHGVHFIKHLDNVKPIPEKEVTFEIHADGIAPVSKLNFTNTNTYSNGSERFYGPQLDIEMTYSDEMSGIQNKYISLDQKEYTEYTKPEHITAEGKHHIQAYSVDNVGNVEKSIIKDFTIDASTPTTDLVYSGPQNTVNNELILGPSGKYTIKSTDNLSGVKKTYYTYDNIKKLNTYNGDPLYIRSFKEGKHSISYHSIDNVKNEEKQKTNHFFLDKTAPEINVKINSDYHVSGQTTYVSERTRLVLSATDNKAGVEEIYYSLGGNKFTNYKNEISIKNNTTLYTYGTDKVKNKGKAKRDQTTYYFDNTAPTISHRYSGPNFFTRDTMFIRATTKIKLSAQDSESKVKNITYSIDNKTSNTYNTPFSSTNKGFHTINYTATDNVNNKTSKNFFFVVDNEAPKIHTHFGSEPLGFKKIRDKEIQIYSKHSKLYLAGTDNSVGTDKLYYSINGGPESLYSNPIKNFITGKNYTVKVRGIDYLGNEDYTTIEFSVEE